LRTSFASSPALKPAFPSSFAALPSAFVTDSPPPSFGMLNRLFEPLRASAAPPASPASAAPSATSGVFALLTTLENVPPPLPFELVLRLPRLDGRLEPLPDFLVPEDERLLVDPRELEREFPDLLRELALERFPELERVLVWAIPASFPRGVIPPLSAFEYPVSILRNEPQIGEFRNAARIRPALGHCAFNVTARRF